MSNTAAEKREIFGIKTIDVQATGPGTINGKVNQKSLNPAFFERWLGLVNAILAFNPVSVKGRATVLKDAYKVSGYPAFVLNGEKLEMSISFEILRHCPAELDPRGEAYQPAVTKKALVQLFGKRLMEHNPLVPTRYDFMSLYTGASVFNRLQVRLDGDFSGIKIKVPKRTNCYLCSGTGLHVQSHKKDRPGSVDRPVTIKSALDFINQSNGWTFCDSESEDSTKDSEDVSKKASDEE